MVAGHVPADNRQTETLMGTTPGGKTIVLVRKKNTSIRVLQFKQGGALPEELQGGFSSVASAQSIVRRYIKVLQDAVDEINAQVALKKEAEDKKAATIAKAKATKAANKAAKQATQE